LQCIAYLSLQHSTTEMLFLAVVYIFVCYECFTPPMVCKRSIMMSLSVCMFTRSHISETARPNFTNFVHDACDRGSVLLWWHCNMLYTSGFVDDVIFSRNEPEACTVRNVY